MALTATEVFEDGRKPPRPDASAKVGSEEEEEERSATGFEPNPEDAGASRPARCRVGVVESDGLPTATMKIKGATKGVKIDTCASFSIASVDMKRFGTRLPAAPPTASVQGLGGRELRVQGVWRFRMVTVYGQVVVMDALVIDGCSGELIMGKDFFVRHRAVVDFQTNEVTYQSEGEQVILPFTCASGEGICAVRVVRGRKVHTQTQALVEVQVTAPDGEVGVFQPHTHKKSLVLIATTLTQVRGGRVRVPVLNAMGQRVKLPARHLLGTWIPLEGNVEVLEQGGELRRDRVLEWLKKTKNSPADPLDNEEDLKIEHLAPEDQELIRTTLRAFSKVAAPDQVCPSATSTGVRHYIPTGDAAPIYQRRLRSSVAENATIDDEVQRMLSGGVIEMGNGPWGFPVVLVRKKDGSVRFCVDYRALNQVTVKDVYPLPRIDETLEALGGAKIFTTLDLMAGYWQVEVAEEDRDKTAFLTRQGLFRFVRMPFELSNAPGTFQRLMDCVLRGLLWVCCLVYLDDIIIFTKGTIERHVVELAVVLARLEEAGLSIKLKKCQFAATRIEYLGHELGQDGVRPVDRLIHAIKECPPPTDPKSVKRFVHLAGYYRRFVPRFGERMQPLTRLLRKGAAWDWGPDQSHAFEDIKAALANKPVLCYPDFEAPFVLATDASVVGLGAVLMQDQGSGLQPIGYASRVNDVHQAKYPATHLECLAVVWAVQHFRPYLYGRQFRVVTDHNALKWLMTKRDLTGKLHRWALALQEYDFTVEYRPGKENVVPDALSRAPVMAVRVHEREERTRDEPRDSAAQLDGATILYYQQRSGQCVRAASTGRVKKLKAEARDGVVYVETDHGWKILLPPALRPLVLRECHESVWAGHLMGQQTLARVKANYWWPQMRLQVLDWVGGCRDCGSRKVRPSRVIPPLRSLRVGALGDRWALDFAGPLPMTARGNRYVVAAIEYLSKWVVLVPMATRAAEPVARLLMERVVFQFGPFRELLMDGAKELQSEIVTALVVALQAKQSTPVPYRPNTMGLVERFNRTWKDMVSMYVNKRQDDWDEWVPSAAYAYNSARNTVTGFSPFQLMTGRDARSPGDLLLAARREDVGDVAAWHQHSRGALREAWRLAGIAIEREQRRQAAWYERKVRDGYAFTVGELVWAFRPPRGKGVTKLRHPWLGPCRIKTAAGYDNFVVSPLDGGDEVLVHESMLLPYYESSAVRESIAAVLQYEEDTGSAAPPTSSVLAAWSGDERAVEESRALLRRTPQGVFFKELARRRVRNPIGRYEFQIQVEILTGPTAGRRQWMGLEEYELLWTQARDIEHFEGTVVGDGGSGSGE